MRIVVTGAGGVALEDADNFRDFRVVAPAALPQDRLAQALGPAAERVDGEHAWIKPAWLAEGQGAAWREGFDGMAAFAASKGWVDAASGAIRAHIERS